MDPFRCYPTYELRNLPSDMPLEYRSRVRVLIPYVEPNLSVADLVYVSKDSSGSVPPSEPSVAPVQNRPWEWTEHLGDISLADNAKENVDTRAHHPSHNSADPQAAIRNSSSLPLDLFAARVIGNGHISAPFEDAKVEGNLRMLQDDALAESVFRRDFREARVDPAVVDAKLSAASRTGDQDVDAANAVATSAFDGRSSSRMASPSGSTRSRGSIQPSAASGSRRASPATTHGSQQLSHSGPSKLAGSSAVEPIDVDMLDVTAPATGSVTSTKRKTADLDDDEVEIVEGPAVARKVKGKAKNR